MADEETKSYLNKWNFVDLIPTFKDQKITIERFKLLRHYIIAELVPEIGRRIDFIQKWEEEFGSSSQSEEHPALTFSRGINVENVSASTSIISSTDSQINSPTTSLNSSPRSLFSHRSLRNKIKNISLPCEYRRRRSFDANYLHALLTRHSFGAALKAEYEENSCLSDSSSILLCDIIASDLIADSSSHLSNNDFADLTDEIVTIFPNENRETYYIPPIFKRNSLENISTHARGRLVNKFHNKLQLYRQMTGSKKKRTSDETKERNIESLDADIKRSLLFLRHSRDYSEILPHWEKTTKIRFEIITRSEESVSSILQQYPILTDPNYGYQLIDIDFKNLYKSDAENLYLNWEPLFNKLWTITSSKKFSKSMQVLRDALLQKDITQHAKEFIQIQLLPFLISPRCSVKVRNQRYWKPTVEESKEGLAIYLKTGGDIEAKHSEKVEQMYARGLTVQPYIIALGDNLINSKNYYVVVDKVRYRFDSPLKALDTCFKLFFTWNANFPIETQQVWIFIQYSLYKFKTKRDIPKPHVNKILQLMGIELPKEIVDQN